MTALCGWIAADPEYDSGRVVRLMGRALRVHPQQVWEHWCLPGIAIGLLEIAGESDTFPCYAPASTADGRYHLWMAGEVFFGGNAIEVRDPDSSRTCEFRRQLLDTILRSGIESVRQIDGEYQIVIWDSRERTGTIVNDRFGGLPLYTARTSEGFAFGGSVAGVLAAPGVSRAPDPEAIREAVTFGGFRLGDRTNVLGVRMIPGGSVVTVTAAKPAARRYWHWRDIGVRESRPIGETVEELHALWQRAVARRLAGARRPGQTLSGGLDSRAILAEAAPVAPQWTAITYGVPGCDDTRYAHRVAETVGATWVFQPLYATRTPDWLQCRTDYIQHTDGLIDLVDLMHLETLPIQAKLLDVNLCGYIGDAVSGPTFNDVSTIEQAMIRLPTYVTPVGLSWTEARARVRTLASELGDAPLRFLLFENKLPQSTNRWSAGWRPWLRVRKPFVDYAFFDFCQSLPSAVRGQGALHERWLRTKYPVCFRTIPNQKTGMPVMTRKWRIQWARARRYTWRQLQPGLSFLGFPARARIRSFHPDEESWRPPSIRSRIEETILRRDSLSCEILGRRAVAGVIRDWFERGAAPTQVIGALYVYEAYHRDLAAHLRAAQSEEG